MSESIERLILRAVIAGKANLKFIAEGCIVIGKTRFLIDTHDGVPVDTSGLRAALTKAMEPETKN